MCLNVEGGWNKVKCHHRFSLTLTPPPLKVRSHQSWLLQQQEGPEPCHWACLCWWNIRLQSCWAPTAVLFAHWCSSDLLSDFKRKNWMLRNLRWITSKPNESIISQSFNDCNYYLVSDSFLKSNCSEAILFLNQNFGFSFDTILMSEVSERFFYSSLLHSL